MVSIILNNNIVMPPIGFGTWKIPDGEEVAEAVKTAIESGYRLIDTAMIYKNENGVGEGIRRSSVDRNELFITTKLWYDDQSYNDALRAIDASLERLDLEYVDLYLMHWPFEKRVETWRAMEAIYKSGRAKAIGVSNFLPRHLDSILKSCTFVPAVNQVEFHPFLYDQLEDLESYCKDKGIQIEGYSPLAHGTNMDHPLVTEIAKKHAKTVPQILLRWSIEKGVIPIPKSTNPERLKQNFAVFDFKLEHTDIEQLDALGNNIRICSDPNELE